MTDHGRKIRFLTRLLVVPVLLLAAACGGADDRDDSAIAAAETGADQGVAAATAAADSSYGEYGYEADGSYGTDGPATPGGGGSVASLDDILALSSRFEQAATWGAEPVGSASFRRGNPPIMDHVVAYHIAFLILAALERRDRTGEGAWIDVAQYEIGVNLVGDLYVSEALGVPVERAGSERADELISGCFAGAGDARWLAVSVRTQEECERVADIVGHTEGSDIAGVRAGLERWSLARPPAEAAEALQAAGVAASPANDIRDLLLNEQLRDRDFFWLVEHDATQERVGVRAFPGSGVHLTSTPARLVSRAPLLGEHNGEIATRLMGFSDEEFEALEAEGTFGTVPAAAAAIPPKQDLPARTSLSTWTYPVKARVVDADYQERLRARFGRFA